MKVGAAHACHGETVRGCRRESDRRAQEEGQRELDPEPEQVAQVRPLLPDPGLGKAMPQETISLESSSTGLSVGSREASALRTDPVVVIFFIRCLPCTRRARETRDPPCIEPGLTPEGLRWSCER